MGETKPLQQLISLVYSRCIDPAEEDRAERTQVPEDWPEHNPSIILGRNLQSAVTDSELKGILSLQTSGERLQPQTP